MAKKAKQQAGVDFEEKERKNAIEFDALKRARANTRLWRIILPVFAILGVLAIIVAAQSMNAVRSMGTELGSRYSELAEEKPGKEAALQAVNAWINKSFPSGADNLWWDTAVKVGEDVETGKEGDEVTAEYWSHRLSFTDLSDGTTREVTQLVEISEGVATPMGDPTVLSKEATGVSTTSIYKPQGYNALDQSESLTGVLGSWASAYVGNDVQALTVLVSDPNASHAYQPAAVGRFDNVSINWLVECDKDGKPVPKKERSDDPAYGAASITIRYRPYQPKQEEDAPDTNTSGSMNITVLLSDPMRGSAKVVDWGADGSMDTLHPYSQALSNKALQATGQSIDEDEEEEEDGADGETAGNDGTTPETQDADGGNTDANTDTTQPGDGAQQPAQ